MLIKEEKKQEEMKEEKNPYEWPKSYYMEIDPGKRRQLLEERIREGDEGEDNLLRMELWDHRYVPLKRSGKKEEKYKDCFMAALMQLLMLSEESSRPLLRKRAEKEISGVLKMLGVDQEAHYTKELLLEEIKHLFLVFAVISMEDKQYSAVIFGLGKMKKEKIERKLLTDVHKVIYNLPENTGMEEKFSLIVQAGEMALRHLGLDNKYS